MLNHLACTDMPLYAVIKGEAHRRASFKLNRGCENMRTAPLPPTSVQDWVGSNGNKPEALCAAVTVRDDMVKAFQLPVLGWVLQEMQTELLSKKPSIISFSKRLARALVSPLMNPIVDVLIKSRCLF